MVVIIHTIGSAGGWWLMVVGGADVHRRTLSRTNTFPHPDVFSLPSASRTVSFDIAPPPTDAWKHPKVRTDPHTHRIDVTPAPVAEQPRGEGGYFQSIVCLFDCFIVLCGILSQLGVLILVLTIRLHTWYA